MCLVPPEVQARLHDADAVLLLRSQGPVGRADAGAITASLAELAARATLHQQTGLALALIGALRACDAVTDAEAQVA